MVSFAFILLCNFSDKSILFVLIQSLSASGYELAAVDSYDDHGNEIGMQLV